MFLSLSSVFCSLCRITRSLVSSWSVRGLLRKTINLYKAPRAIFFSARRRRIFYLAEISVKGKRKNPYIYVRRRQMTSKEIDLLSICAINVFVPSQLFFEQGRYTAFNSYVYKVIRGERNPMENNRLFVFFFSDNQHYSIFKK